MIKRVTDVAYKVRPKNLTFEVGTDYCDSFYDELDRIIIILSLSLFI